MPAITPALSDDRPTVTVTHLTGLELQWPAPPALDGRDLAGWWGWAQTLALPQGHPHHAHEQAWIDRIRPHGPGTCPPDPWDAAWVRDRLGAELMGAELDPTAGDRSADSAESTPVRTTFPRKPPVFRLRPSMQEALVRVLLARGVVGSSDLTATLAGAPNVALVRAILTSEAPRGLGERTNASTAGGWRSVWPNALYEVAESLWSSAGEMAGLLMALGWPVDGLGIAVNGHAPDRTPLARAVRHTNAPVVDALLHAGADPFLRPRCTVDGTAWDGLSAWDQALSATGEEMLPRLLPLAHTAGRVNAQALRRALIRGAAAAVDRLLAEAVDPFPVDEPVRPGHLPDLLRLATVLGRRKERQGEGENGFTDNRRRLEQVWLRRQAEATDGGLAPSRTRARL